METYLVGGAVRDKLLGFTVRERDWVVVGSTAEAMRALGYQPVGKDFPVFLHPQTKEEYALARTERKTGPGYTGFETNAGPGITLEDDLLRRDLTINAMAETADGELIDPYGGKEDLDNGLLRHVSAAFAEDPVRILRIARFAARFAKQGFHVAHTTNALMRSMVDSGEVDHLVPERVWAELVKALATDNPNRFFRVLAGCAALEILFPEWLPLLRVESEKSHGQADIELAVLQQAVTQSDDLAVRFAALVCDLDQGTPGGLKRQTLSALCDRQRIPNACRELAVMAIQQRHQAQAADSLSAIQLLELLNTLDAFRRTDRFKQFLQVCAADKHANNGDFNSARLQQALDVARAVRAGELQQQGLAGKEIGAALQQRRIQAIEEIL
jgi:tRNA nucleotidyltransferase (CCA-adding enzyme)